MRTLEIRRTDWYHSDGTNTMVRSPIMPVTAEPSFLDLLTPMSPQALAVFSMAVFTIAITPGPNNLVAMTNGVRHGMVPAMVAGLGRLVAFALLIVLTAVGLGAIVAASETAFHVIKWFGVAYLLYLGVKVWRAPVEERQGLAGGPSRKEPVSVLFRHEFMIAAGNPKAILMFTALFPQFLDPSQPALPQFAFMGLVYLPLEWLALAGYAIGGRGIARFTSTARGQLILNRVSASALLGAGVLLAVSRRD